MNKNKHEPPKASNINNKRKTFFDKNEKIINNNKKSIFSSINNLKGNNQNLLLNFNFKSKAKRNTLKKITKINEENSTKALRRKTTTGFERIQTNKILFPKKNPEKYTDTELNSMDYEEAIKFDHRTYIQYYFSLIKTQHILIFTFFVCDDYNSQIIKIYLFMLSFSLNYVMSAVFYSDDTMHKIYIDKGSFDFTYQLPQMIYSSLISFFLEMLPNNLGLYEENILEARKRNKDSLNKIIKDVYRGIIIKIAFFFLLLIYYLFLSGFI